MSRIFPLEFIDDGLEVRTSTFEKGIGSAGTLDSEDKTPPYEKGRGSAVTLDSEDKAPPR